MKKTFLKSMVLILAFVVMLSLTTGCGGSKAAPTNSETPTTTDQKDSQANGQQADTQKKNSDSNTDTAFKNADKKRVKAKGMYLTGTSAGTRLDFYIDTAKKYGLNCYVIDYKDDGEDEGGLNVKADSNVPLAKEIGAVAGEYKAAEVTKKLHDNGIYAIARIVCFKDPMLAKKKPEFQIKNKSDGSTFIHNKVPWVSAYDKDVWDYNIALAKEALANGFDEVQFDYVRFPDLLKSQYEKLEFPGNDGKDRKGAINAFLEYARQQMPDAILSADIFAIVIESISDGEAIGQEFETVGKHMDYICPMAYPSHYANGQIINGVKFPTPDLDPYNVILQTLLKGKDRLSKVDGHKPIIRTYIQDFTASWVKPYQKYGPEQVKQQIQAIKDAGYEEFLMWSPMNVYHPEGVH